MGQGGRAWAKYARPLQWCITLGLVALLLLFVDLRALARTLVSIDLPLLALAIGLAFVDRALMIAKWYPLVHMQDPAISIGEATRAYLAAGFASLVLPTPVSGDVLRAVALGRRHNTVAEIGASIAAERVLGLISSVLLCVVALTVATHRSDDFAHLVPWVVGSVVVTAAVVLLPFQGWVAGHLSRWLATQRQGKVMQFVQRFGLAYHQYRRATGVLVIVGLLSIVEQTIPIFCTWILARALGTSATLVMLVVAVPLALFLARLPIAVAGIGVAEGALVYLLRLYDVPAYEALALGLAGTFLNLVVAVPGAFLWTDLVGLRQRVS